MVCVTDLSKTVFLSYASQDAAAGELLCQALRAAGVVVWFDRSELRGGVCLSVAFVAARGIAAPVRTPAS